jgi:TRAP transporter TAXI family solute receptor
MANQNEERGEEQLDALLAAFLSKLDSGESIDREAFLRQSPEYAPQLRELLDAADLIESLAGPLQSEIHGNVAAAPPVPNARETDFSIDEAYDPTAATVQFMANREVVSLSNPGRAVSPHETTAEITERGGFVDIARVGPENTQPILPCRFGDYILERILGRGGMGVVYLAHQVRLERRVAIKMIRAGCLAGESEIERFYTEARSAARLDHPNIVSVYQCGEIDGHHYFSMDYIDGTDLEKRIRRDPLPPRDAARYVRDVARAIAYAHAQGVLHRDLKPANVIIDQDDEIIITDFGLAKLMDSEEGLTRSGAALGTPGYMSPEQADARSEEQGEATDVYALGAVLFATLAGRPPFVGTSPVQTIMDVAHKPAPHLRTFRKDAHIDLDTIVAKCLQKDPSARYASAHELADELDRFLRHEPIRARPASWPRKTFRWLMHVPIIAALVGTPSAAPTTAHRWTQRILISLLFLLTSFLLIGNRFSRWWIDATLPTSVTIATGGTSGAYFRIAGDFSDRFKAMTGMNPSVDTTAGSKDNVDRLLQRRADLAVVQGTVLQDNRIVIVAPLYYEAVHLLARKSLKAGRLEDLAGKRVAIGRADSGTRQAFEMLRTEMKESLGGFETVECDWSELPVHHDLDACFAVVRIGHPEIQAMIGSDEFQLLPLPNTQQISLDQPMLRPYEVSSADYVGINKTITTLATPAFLAARSDTSNRLVLTCLEIIYGQDKPIQGLLTREAASHFRGWPLHPAARMFFDAVGE